MVDIFGDWSLVFPIQCLHNVKAGKTMGPVLCLFCLTKAAHYYFLLIHD